VRLPNRDGDTALPCAVTADGAAVAEPIGAGARRDGATGWFEQPNAMLRTKEKRPRDKIDRVLIRSTSSAGAVADRSVAIVANGNEIPLQGREGSADPHGWCGQPGVSRRLTG